MDLKALENELFEIQNDSDFEKTALKIFDFQQDNCRVYRDFVKKLNRPKPTCIQEIPCLPISFFKTHEIRSKLNPVEVVFKSSGTTGSVRSSHFVESTALYQRSFIASYASQIGNPSNQIILALLPNYVAQGDSSLVYMVEHLIHETKHPLSGFYLNELGQFIEAFQLARKTSKEIVLFGVSYALLDLADQQPVLTGARIIETGGMKGKRKELSKEELHQTLKNAFEVPYISSEYGMTELLSQAYSNQDGLFDFSPWMKIMIRDVNDPLSYLEDGKTGGINVFDLANLYSCSFISTQDLGKIQNNQLQLMGRFDHSDIRGCNLLVE